MNENIVNRILDTTKQASELYSQLVIISAPSGKGKTQVLQAVSQETGTPVINVNLRLSHAMLDLTSPQRMLQLPQLLDEIIAKSDHGVVLLDNIEILFDTGLKQNPMALLKKISRNRTVVATWNGTIDDNCLIYARQGHSEYGRYEIDDIIVITL